MPIQRIEIETRPPLPDALAEQTQRKIEAWHGRAIPGLRRRTIYHLDLDLEAEEAERVLRALVDPTCEIGTVGMLPDPFGPEPTLALTIGYRPGVTDSVGASVKRAAEDCLGRPLVGHAYASTLWLVEGLSADEAERAAAALLHNPLIERARVQVLPRGLDLEVPRAGANAEPRVQTVPLRGASDAELVQLSRRGLLALELVEMRAIAAHFEERGRDPTDAELECLAQTWSEHCKHKIFAAPIEFQHDGGEVERIEEGLFRRFIRGATQAVAEARRAAGLDPEDAPFLVSVFHDNAGVVRFTDDDHLVYKVETHNSPSALDPYGGAMTGIVGVNRDSFGTGLGADLLANVWGYCFGDPRHVAPLPPGVMHPARLRAGVHRGVIDGGNQSGIPYARGFELFDARYLGKPLVFCGTVAVMPAVRAGRPTHEKPIALGDAIVMIGGRIGKDGIHGATFSSIELNDDSPVQAVQIGDPLTQKMMFDMLTEARDRGLMSGMTDNGAGGLSSSVGELATATGGAWIDLARAPLKYPGLLPWEILISEAQERMTVAVPPDRVDAFLELAARREVEATVLGAFTDDGRLVVRYGEQTVVDLPLGFLHDGVPRIRLRARIEVRPRAPVDAGAFAEFVAPGQIGARWLALLARPGLASHERLARRYDHEVKGLSVVKPFVGVRRDVPATATVMRARHGSDAAVVLGEGVHPFYADLDARAMAEAAVDEAVRRVLCAGARIDRLAGLDNFCWPDPVRSEKTPDGEHKLAQLVLCCRGLRAACEAYGLPLVSGKDSMKNDAVLGGVKISIPPTLLVSVMGQMADVRRALTLVPRSEGDRVWLLGPRSAALGGSEVLRMGGFDAGEVPRTDLAAAARRYRAFAAARDAGYVRSAHVCSRGGLAIVLAHLVLASERWIELSLDPLADDPFVALFAEDTGRIVFTSSEQHAEAIARELGPHGLVSIGRVGAPVEGGGVRVQWGEDELVLTGEALRAAYTSGPTTG